ncbi:sporulation protein YunB [Pullulanibacillus sp. KACC 23026]|uniref:sporulation protein YunB n=1 Tax=Pullulanibacillus sp. KACC 23026 TaxID=3028315 RepID=UPI0023AF01B5|nr:sporulation protein YunB [Pullulanibacillus sp. KACC 23026]WEG13734.1 sporulation protein YunB [Pullulanibacillus sp. KACC 23026]
MVYLVMTFLGLRLASHILEPTLKTMAEFEARKAMTYAFNYSLSTARLTDLPKNPEAMTQTPKESYQDFFITKTNNQGKPVLVSYDTAKVNAFLHDKTQRLEDFLYAMEDGTITFPPNYNNRIQIHQKPMGHSTEIPLGLLTHLPLLGGLGPRIPIRFDFLSELSTHVKSEVKPVGVNSVHLTLYVQATTKVQLIMPFPTDPIKVEKNIPIGDITVTGEVPKYYQGSPSSNAKKQN